MRDPSRVVARVSYVYLSGHIAHFLWHWGLTARGVVRLFIPDFPLPVLEALTVDDIAADCVCG